MCVKALRTSGPVSKSGSSIDNISSVSGLAAALLDPLYSMTKGGATLFTKSTAVIFAKKGDRLRVNAVHPEIIDTQLGHLNVDLVARKHGVKVKVKVKDEGIKLSAERHPLGRLGTATDVAEAVLYLSSDASSSVTGSS